jgi:uncharacterized protein YggE
MVTFEEVVKLNCKCVRAVCNDNDVYIGKCYVYSELNNDDEIEDYVTVNNVHIPIEDLAEIAEINDG